METHGRVVLLAGADPGFFLDATGMENIIQLANAYGVGEQEIEDFVSSIVDFAEIGGAIDRNVRGYSTGMKGKLGFGFMTALNPSAHVDETLEVGDAEFRARHNRD